MDASTWQQKMQAGGWVDLSRRAKLCFTGADRLRFLNGQLTQEVRLATNERAVPTCVTDLKGKIVGEGWLTARADTLVLDADADLAETIGPRLERYIIADDVEMVDHTDDWALWHWLAPEGATEAPPPGPEDGNWVAAPRWGAPGWDLWLPASARWQPAADAPLWTAEEVECLRVLRGIPAWPAELNADHFPPEAGLEAYAMSFTKGCYMGQEVLSRIKTTGKMPQRLVAWRSAAAPPDPPSAGIAAGASVWLPGTEQPVGAVTSVVRDPASRQWVGMAYVKQSALPEDSRLLVGADLTKLTLQIHPIQLSSVS
ncbi:MAG: hypothetical protein KDK99_16425 [Verrucomicrobiales bacterium]|nr:hypothetical protein [Verrucomicrobiales bacterium]